MQIQIKTRKAADLLGCLVRDTRITGRQSNVNGKPSFYDFKMYKDIPNGHF